MQNAIKELLRLNIKNRKELMRAKRWIAKKFNVCMPSSPQVLNVYNKLVEQRKMKPCLELERILRKRAIRTLSGIAPVAVLTKPYPCPGNCAYCPTEKNVPQSYLSNEPAVMRAIRCGYHPYIQVQDRLRALIANGHEPTKIELIVIGGTWSCLPQKYKYWYVLNLFAAANKFKIKNEKLTIKSCPVGKNEILSVRISMKDLKKALLKEQKRNEKSRYKIIGLTLETRPDYINDKELIEMRDLGCTRVEIGVQAIDDNILKFNKRGHGVKEITDATKLLKNYGFKVTYHIMPGLPGSSPAKDFKMFKQLFSDERFQPDQIKFYPCVVTKGSLLYRWWKQGKYKPYTAKQLESLIIKCKAIVPRYVRIIRLIRDIPGVSIVAGNKITNLRQVLKNKGVKCNCIRCREARECEFKVKSLKLKVIDYNASEGKELFISYESKDKKILYGFCRLRLSGETAIIRELHVYGELMSVGLGKKRVQHAGLGKKLLKEAERIAKQAGCQKIIIISGVGVRDYYRKFGYRLDNTYMVKSLTKH